MAVSGFVLDMPLLFDDFVTVALREVLESDREEPKKPVGRRSDGSWVDFRLVYSRYTVRGGAAPRYWR